MTAPISISPNATGLDQTIQLYNWLHANKGKTCQLAGTSKDNPFRLAGLRLPTQTRIQGSIGTPFTAGNPGTYISPVRGYTGVLLYGEPVGMKLPWSHGTILEGIGCINDSTASIGLRWCGGEVSAIRDCSFSGFTQAGLELIGGSAPFFAENLSVYNNRYGVWIVNAGGSMTFEVLSGDDNDSLVCVENSNDDPNDPNSGGRITSITIRGIKAETGNWRKGPSADASHNPLIRFIEANETYLGIHGGVVQDWGSLLGNKAIVHIERVSATSRSAYVSIEGLKNDNYQYAIVDDVLNVRQDVATSSAWAPPGLAAFAPIYHEHRIQRTRTP